ncbi:MAG: hypothetical protein IJQ71_08910 [Clostridia bacterium]|nr:hypothetical protein [Clostridia bacterium]
MRVFDDDAGTYLTISFSAGFAIKQLPLYFSDDIYLYGVLTEKEGSFFKIEWEDGSSDSFYYIIDDKGNKKLMNDMYTESYYKESNEGAQCMFLGAYFYWASKQ